MIAPIAAKRVRRRCIIVPQNLQMALRLPVVAFWRVASTIPKAGARLATLEAIERAGRTGPLAAGVALGQEGANRLPGKKGGAALADRFQPVGLPVPPGVLVDAATGCQFRCAVNAVKLHPSRIGPVWGMAIRPAHR
jgi:hypothetical protein